MYTPKNFKETRIEVMHELMRARPLATLITLCREGLDANHIPLLIREDGTPYGTLEGHVARANPVWSDRVADVEALAVFHGPDAYISPSWYATKEESGKVVPTWNYAVVHAYGPLQVVEDAAWLRSQIESLTAGQEARFREPWTIADAPRDYTEEMIRNIIGIRITITRLSGKWKASQNQPPRNQAGVAEGLRRSASPQGSSMADLVDSLAKIRRG